MRDCPGRRVVPRTGRVVNCDRKRHRIGLCVERDTGADGSDRWFTPDNIQEVRA